MAVLGDGAGAARDMAGAVTADAHEPISLAIMDAVRAGDPSACFYCHAEKGTLTAAARRIGERRDRIVFCRDREECFHAALAWTSEWLPE